VKITIYGWSTSRASWAIGLCSRLVADPAALRSSATRDRIGSRARQGRCRLRPHPYHSCCRRPPVVEGAVVKRSGVSVADRGEPEASRSEWHADGTAGEDDCGSGLAATVPARAMGEAGPR
jgi:hypothetical protein